MEANTKWPFKDDPGTPCVTTKQVTSGQQPIVYASRETDEDGELVWQFHCAEGFKMEDAQMVRLDTVLSIDPSIIEIADLPLGYEAKRTSPNAEWTRQKQQAV